VVWRNTNKQNSLFTRLLTRTWCEKSSNKIQHSGQALPRSCRALTSLAYYQRPPRYYQCRVSTACHSPQSTATRLYTRGHSSTSAGTVHSHRPFQSNNSTVPAYMACTATRIALHDRRMRPPLARTLWASLIYNLCTTPVVAKRCTPVHSCWSFDTHVLIQTRPTLLPHHDP
jgi:hypothetical protein